MEYPTVEVIGPRAADAVLLTFPGYGQFKVDCVTTYGVSPERLAQSVEIAFSKTRFPIVAIEETLSAFQPQRGVAHMRDALEPFRLAIDITRLVERGTDLGPLVRHATKQIKDPMSLLHDCELVVLSGEYARQGRKARFESAPKGAKSPDLEVDGLKQELKNRAGYLAEEIPRGLIPARVGDDVAETEERKISIGPLIAGNRQGADCVIVNVSRMGLGFLARAGLIDEVVPSLLGPKEDSLLLYARDSREFSTLLLTKAQAETGPFARVAPGWLIRELRPDDITRDL